MRCRSLVPLSVLLVPALAAAHIRITSPTPRSTTVLKQRHCGATGSARANVQTYRPGATLHLVWDEYIPHPGWFRVAFQQNGDTFETPKESNGPRADGTPSNFPTENLTGQTDAATGSLIIADRIAHPALSYDVVLPSVECSNCTLQLIQVMTDKLDYAADTTSDDIYYACVDLVLSAATATPDAGPGPGMPDAGGNAATTGGGGGCSTAGGGTGLVALALVGLVLGRRTRGQRRYGRAGAL